MIDTLDLSHTFCSQTRDNQTSTGTKVRRHDRSTGEFLAPGHYQSVAFHTNIGSHPPQFFYMHKPTLEHSFGYDTRAFGQAHQRNHLRLHVGGKPWERQGPDVGS